MTVARNDGSVVMEGVRIIFRNFEGKEGMYNQKGSRNFAVILDEDTAQAMAADGWNVRRLKPRETDEEPTETPYLTVNVSYKNRPPIVVMIGARGRTNLTESEVEILDWVDIANVDLIVSPYEWNVNGKTGISAYLRSIYVTVNEDELALKYADVPDAANASEE